MLATLAQLPSAAATVTSGVTALAARLAPPQRIECQSGWYPLLVALDTTLSQLAPDYHLLSVKEKFGSLHYYVDINDDDVRSPQERTELCECVSAVIRLAERRSARLCEICGAPGRLSSKSGYYTTRCPTHRPLTRGSEPIATA